MNNRSTVNGVTMPTEFRNEPLIDFTKEENVQAMRSALEKVKSQLGQEYPLVIGGERMNTESKLDSISPANRTQLVGKFQKATKDLANRAVETAHETFQTWRNTPPDERAHFLFRAAALTRPRQHDTSACPISHAPNPPPQPHAHPAHPLDFL